MRLEEAIETLRRNLINGAARSVRITKKSKVSKRKSAVKSVKKVAKKSGGKSTNPWMIHLAKFRKAHPELKPVELTKAAAKTYKK